MSLDAVGACTYQTHVERPYALSHPVASFEEEVPMLTQDAEPWVRALSIIIALLVVTTVYGIAIRSMVAWSRRFAHPLAHAFLNYEWRPMYVGLVAFTMQIAVPMAVPPGSSRDLLLHGTGLVLIASVGWFVLRLFNVAEKALLERFPINVRDNLRARSIYTQFTTLRTVAAALVGLFTVAAMLMTFDYVRQLGVGLLASAGLAGIIIGMAAQPLVANILASIQVAFTEPIRVDDVVIVEGEWGRIEEITLTYVVVRIWDMRRLVVPISHFVQRPFQNWTRVSADLMGTVFIYTDYTVPVEAVRAEVHRIVEASPLWDKKVVGLQVTDSKERTLELRALISAADSGAAWDLRCHLREQLIGFLQREYPHALPRVRLEGPSDRLEEALRSNGAK
jgi:small-conductance mechanosensitive channel